jgi:hypothetical protein
MRSKLKLLQLAIILVILIDFAFSSDIAKATIDSKKEAKYSTPQLIKMSYKNGEIDSDVANLYLARALQNNNNLPSKYRGEIPYDGTFVILELRKSLNNGKLRASTTNEISSIIESFCEADGIPTSLYQLSSSTFTEHFYIEYEEITGGLDIQDYINTLETTWSVQIDDFGWAAPPVFNENPPPNNLYHVRILNLSPDVYGFVSTIGTHAGFVGDNPNTAWDDKDASATCMVLNNNYVETGSNPLIAAQVTAAHEFHHSIQYGYTDLFDFNSFGIAPNYAFIEGGATWMEDEIFDNANDNYQFLWPRFDDSLGFPSESYSHWITIRGLTEKFGSGIEGGSEQVMQDFWENISKGSVSEIEALNIALLNKGTNLSDAFQAYAIAVKYNKPCSENYVYPYCLEEGPQYVAAAGVTQVSEDLSLGETYSESLSGGYALSWVSLPKQAIYNVVLKNIGSSSGEFRASVVCDTGNGFIINKFPIIVHSGQSSSLQNLDTSNCNSTFAVVVNQEISPGGGAFSLEAISTSPPVGIISQGSNDGGTNPTPCEFSLEDNEVYLGGCFDGGDITSGFRFENIQIPHNANIEYAYIRFTVDGEYTSPISVFIDAEASGNPLMYSEASPPTNRLTTGNPVTWTIRETWQLGERWNTPNLANPIQNIVNRSDWNIGQPISIIIKNNGSTNHRRVIGFERADFDPNLETAQLFIIYNTNPTPTPTALPPNVTPQPTFTIQPTYTHIPTSAPPTVAPTTQPVCNCIIKAFCQSNTLRTNSALTSSPMPTGTIAAPSSLRSVESLDLTDPFAREELIYRLRDEVMSQSSEGQRLATLYYEHSLEITILMLSDAELYNQGFEVLDSFLPGLQAMVDGQGDTISITEEQVQAAQAFLDELETRGSPELQQAIESEREHLPLENMIGMTMNEAWGYTNGYKLEWLPPIGNSNPYSGNQGSTIPVKFTITDFEGNFVADESVTLYLLDSNENVIIGPIQTSNNPNNGIKIQGNQYHYNLKTKGLSEGSYTLKVLYHSTAPDQFAIYLIQITKK